MDVDLYNIYLSFNVLCHVGGLVIMHNNKIIFDGEISKQNIDPIRLDNFGRDNELIFMSSSPGVAFWRVNKYELSNIKVTGDITRKDAQKTKTMFIIDREEKDNLKSAKLMFIPECTAHKVGKLTIIMNRQVIYSGIPDCGVLYMQEFLPYYLVEGENYIEFEADAGRYFLDRIKIITELKQPRDFIYDFFINRADFSAIQSGVADAYIVMDFIDDIEYKEAQLIINGHLTHLSTSCLLYTSPSPRDLSTSRMPSSA